MLVNQKRKKNIIQVITKLQYEVVVLPGIRLADTRLTHGEWTVGADRRVGARGCCDTTPSSRAPRLVRDSHTTLRARIFASLDRSG